MTVTSGIMLSKEKLMDEAHSTTIAWFLIMTDGLATYSEQGRGLCRTRFSCYHYSGFGSITRRDLWTTSFDNLFVHYFFIR
ncbi:hypothetical protein ES332_A13G052500v1 [Gossypium tomentosum]|nr:hypothetical protein ES332_A13G052500v1 [Gossypium tomentosum]